MKLALHRSITFWSGIFVIGFICWAWRDSARTWTYAGYGGLNVLNEECGVEVVWTARDAISPNAGRFTPARGDGGPGMRMTWPRYLCKAGGESTEDCLARYLKTHGPSGHREDDKLGTISDIFTSTIIGAPGSWTLYVPHWCLVAALIPAWMGLLLWRARRRRRAIEKNPELAPS